MIIREANENDLKGLLELYTHLHNNPFPESSCELTAIWNSICKDTNHHIIIAEAGGVIVSSCVCVIIPNLTHNQMPYALVENVVTHTDYRNKGYATMCLEFACETAKSKNCYKIMLLTGSKNEKILNFYKKAGFNSSDKTAFIKWF